MLDPDEVTRRLESPTRGSNINVYHDSDECRLPHCSICESNHHWDSQLFPTLHGRSKCFEDNCFCQEDDRYFDWPSNTDPIAASSSAPPSAPIPAEVPRANLALSGSNAARARCIGPDNHRGPFLCATCNKVFYDIPSLAKHEWEEKGERRCYNINCIWSELNVKNLRLHEAWECTTSEYVPINYFPVPHEREGFYNGMYYPDHYSPSYDEANNYYLTSKYPCPHEYCADRFNNLDTIDYLAMHLRLVHDAQPCVLEDCMLRSDSLESLHFPEDCLCLWETPEQKAMRLNQASRTQGLVHEDSQTQVAAARAEKPTSQTPSANTLGKNSKRRRSDTDIHQPETFKTSGSTWNIDGKKSSAVRHATKDGCEEGCGYLNNQRREKEGKARRGRPRKDEMSRKELPPKKQKPQRREQLQTEPAA